MGLIILLFDVALSLDVPFGTLQYVQYILQGPPLCPIHLRSPQKVLILW